MITTTRFSVTFLTIQFLLICFFWAKFQLNWDWLPFNVRWVSNQNFNFGSNCNFLWSSYLLYRTEKKMNRNKRNVDGFEAQYLILIVSGVRPFLLIYSIVLKYSRNKNTVCLLNLTAMACHELFSIISIASFLFNLLTPAPSLPPPSSSPSHLDVFEAAHERQLVHTNTHFLHDNYNLMTGRHLCLPPPPPLSPPPTLFSNDRLKNRHHTTWISNCL